MNGLYTVSSELVLVSCILYEENLFVHPLWDLKD